MNNLRSQMIGTITRTRPLNKAFNLTATTRSSLSATPSLLSSPIPSTSYAASASHLNANSSPVFTQLGVRFATKRTAGGTQNTKDSHSKHLGIKCTSGTMVDDGIILVRQRGTKYRPGWGVSIGRDHTLVATRQGVVRFWYDLPRQKHYVCVDDGSLPTPILPSKDEAKRRLAGMVDLEVYMKLRGEDRYRYMMGLVRKYDEQLRKEVLEAADKWITGVGENGEAVNRRKRRCGLVDLTRL